MRFHRSKGSNKKIFERSAHIDCRNTKADFSGHYGAYRPVSAPYPEVTRLSPADQLVFDVPDVVFTDHAPVARAAQHAENHVQERGFAQAVNARNNRHTAGQCPVDASAASRAWIKLVIRDPNVLEQRKADHGEHSK